jgi:uncharacterized protein (TIGR03083 family)
VTGRYPHPRNCDLLDAEVSAFVTTVRGADPATPVRTCERWKLVDLIHHTTHVHRWVAGMVAVYATQRHSRRKADLPLPADPTGYPDWLGEAHTMLVPVLRAADPDRPMWTWGADRHAGFWSRRMVHETAVHRADASLALGQRPVVGHEVAVDGVDEVLGLISRARRFRPEVGRLRGAGSRLRFAATDRPEEWTVTLTDTGYEWTAGPVDDAVLREVAVRASAADLYLLLWHRLPPDDPGFAVSGDGDLLGFWLANSPI